MNGTIAVVIAALIAVLAAIGLATGSKSSTPATQAAAPAGPSIATIAHRIERVRELRFKRLPPVRRVNPSQARADALADLDRQVPPHDIAGEQELLRLLGLIPPDAGLRKLLGKAFGSEVGGYYDPRTGKLAVVGGSGGLVREVTLAHELTHALEDQHFGLDAAPGTGFNRDRSIAETTVHEGTATLAMVDYVIFKQTGQTQVPDALRRRVLSALDQAAVPSSSGLPRYLRESLVFPYPTGARLVDRVQRGGGWTAVNRLFGRDAPVSSEQVMHPAKLRSHEPPVRVRVGGASSFARGDFGEFDTEQLLRAANGRARSRAAAAGWGGGGFAISRLAGGRDRLVLRWVYDSKEEADGFVPALRRTAAGLRGVTRVAQRGREVTLTLQANRHGPS
jgi:hypothetical protein